MASTVRVRAARCGQKKSEPSSRLNARRTGTVCLAAHEAGSAAHEGSRRELLLASVNVGVLGSLLTWGAVPRPSSIGIQDYGGGVRTLSLCPPTPNCISTADEANDLDHYVPPLTYNPEDGRGSRKPATQEQALEELAEVVSTLRPDGFTPTIVKQTPDYLYAEYQSPTFGFIDDVEFWFRPNNRVEYRSASRIGESDGAVNRKRIKAIRQALEKKGWASTGF